MFGWYKIIGLSIACAVMPCNADVSPLFPNLFPSALYSGTTVLHTYPQSLRPLIHYDKVALHHSISSLAAKKLSLLRYNHVSAHDDKKYSCIDRLVACQKRCMQYVTNWYRACIAKVYKAAQNNHFGLKVHAQEIVDSCVDTYTWAKTKLVQQQAEELVREYCIQKNISIPSDVTPITYIKEMDESAQADLTAFLYKKFVIPENKTHFKALGFVALQCDKLSPKYPELKECFERNVQAKEARPVLEELGDLLQKQHKVPDALYQANQEFKKPFTDWAGWSRPYISAWFLRHKAYFDAKFAELPESKA